MNEPSSQPVENRDLKRFKELVLKDETRAIETIRDHLEEISAPDYLGKTLPEALQSSHHQVSDALANALQKPLVDAIHLGSTSNRKGLSSALFPVLGPAIRLYVAETFRSMFEQLNENIRAATSLRRLKWLFEAKITGTPYSEYVLLKTLDYRIDNLLLVCPKTGLLLQQIARNSEDEENPELISSMLVAIRSFARDSFSSGEESDEELGRFSFGEKDVFLESGPSAILAAVSNGNPPSAFREEMRQVLETIHETASAELAGFSGDPASIEDLVAPQLRTLLWENSAPRSAKSSGSKWRAWLVVICIMTLLCWTIFQQVQDRVYRARIVAQARSVPGFEIVEFKNNWLTPDSLSLLRDPMAQTVSSVFQKARVPENWRKVNETAYLSLEEPFASERARRKALQEELAEKRRREQEALQDQETMRREAEMRREHDAEISSLREELSSLTQFANSVKGDQIPLIRSVFFAKYPIEETADLDWLGGLNWELSGFALEPHYSEILRNRDHLIVGGGTVSLDKFQHDLVGELSAIRRDIEEITVDYHDASRRITSAGLRARGKLIQKLSELVNLHRSLDSELPIIELHSTPVVGIREEENEKIAAARLKAESDVIRNSPVGLVFAIEKVSDAQQPIYRRGVYALLKYPQ